MKFSEFINEVGNKIKLRPNNKKIEIEDAHRAVGEYVDACHKILDYKHLYKNINYEARATDFGDTVEYCEIGLFDKHDDGRNNELYTIAVMDTTEFALIDSNHRELIRGDYKKIYDYIEKHMSSLLYNK